MRAVCGIGYMLSKNAQAVRGKFEMIYMNLNRNSKSSRISR